LPRRHAAALRPRDRVGLPAARAGRRAPPALHSRPRPGHLLDLRPDAGIRPPERGLYNVKLVVGSLFCSVGGDVAPASRSKARARFFPLSPYSGRGVRGEGCLEASVPLTPDPSPRVRGEGKEPELRAKTLCTRPLPTINSQLPLGLAAPEHIWHDAA